MRTPPPVLPSGEENSPGYKRTWFDREGPDAGLRLKAVSYGATVTAITFAGLMLFANKRRQAALRLGRCSSFPLRWSLFYSEQPHIGPPQKLGDRAGAVAKSFTLPSGSSTPYEQTFSISGSDGRARDVAGALESYEAIIRRQAAQRGARLRAAGEHYARGNRNPARAAELFRAVRETAGVSTHDALYSSSRLVDLYDGPLGEPGRALVELRRIIETYPQSRRCVSAAAT